MKKLAMIPDNDAIVEGDGKGLKLSPLSRIIFIEKNYEVVLRSLISHTKCIFTNFQLENTSALYPLTDRFHNEHNKCIHVTQVIFSATHVGSSVFLPSVFDHQIFSNHHVTLDR